MHQYTTRNILLDNPGYPNKIVHTTRCRIPPTDDEGEFRPHVTDGKHADVLMEGSED